MAMMLKSSIAARTSVKAAAARPMWYPGATAPKHLDGTMLGDYGFDPLRLGTNPESLKWYQEAELTNGRWAMSAVAGVLFTELVGLPNFWEAGAGDMPLDFKTLVAFQVVFMGVAEAFHYSNFKEKGVAGFGPVAPFDPMGMASEETKLKEIKNARLAMCAWVGFCSQAAVQGKGPIACLKDHIADPYNANIYTSSVGKETVVTITLLCIWPMFIEAQKTLNDGKDEKPTIAFWASPWEK